VRNHGFMLTARIAVALWVAAWVGPLAPAPARAEQGGAEEQAVAHHERGLELYQASQYADAAREFEAAHALLAAPENLFNLARCYERLGDLPRAIAMFEQYVQADLPPDRRARGQAELERLRAAVGGAAPQPAPGAEVDLVVVSEPAGAEVLIDGRPQPQRTPAVVRVSPGAHVVEARLEGHADARQDVQILAGTASRVELALTPLPPGAAPVTPPGGGAGETAPPDTRRVHLSGAAQVGGGASLSFDASFHHAGLVSVELSGGLDLGRARRWRRVGFWPVRLELLVDAAIAPADNRLLTFVEARGRLSLALFRVPLRLEGEAGGGWAYVENATNPYLNGAVTIGLSIFFQALPWLEAGLRLARIDIIFVDGSSIAVRYGIEALIRFRI
jgi:hypothetical protein